MQVRKRKDRVEFTLPIPKKPHLGPGKDDASELRLPRLPVGGHTTWSSYSDDMLKYYETEESRVHQKRTVYTRDRASKDRLFEEKFVKGDVTLKRIRSLLGMMGMVQTKIFRDVTNAMIMCNLHHMYGKDFERCLPRLLKEFGESEFYQMWILTTMRQAGKTSAIQAGCAAIMLSVERFKFVCLGPRRRHAQVIMSGTVDNIRRMGLNANIVVGGAGEYLHVTPIGSGEPSRTNVNNNILRCIPGDEKGKIKKEYSLFCVVSVM
jgi:hypothetical protein